MYLSPSDKKQLGIMAKIALMGLAATFVEVFKSAVATGGPAEREDLAQILELGRDKVTEGFDFFAKLCREAK